MANEIHFKDQYKYIIKYLKTADSSIDVAVAWFTDNEIFQVLCQNAKNGVDIRLILLDDHINRGGLDFQRFTNLGGEIYWIPTSEKSQNKMHHKFCIIDNDIVINGSYNWTFKARTNSENITISTDDPTTISAFSDEFEGIWIPYKKVQEAAKVEAERLAKIAAEKAEAERLAKIATEKAEAERLAKIATEKAEAERLAKIATEKVEAERLAKIATEKAEAERLAKIEAARFWQQQEQHREDKRRKEESEKARKEVEKIYQRLKKEASAPAPSLTFVPNPREKEDFKQRGSEPSQNVKYDEWIKIQKEREKQRQAQAQEKEDLRREREAREKEELQRREDRRDYDKILKRQAQEKEAKNKSDNSGCLWIVVFVILGAYIFNDQSNTPATYVQPASAYVQPVPTSRYHDNGDGTVKDLITGLEWMRCSLGQNLTSPSCEGEVEVYKWNGVVLAIGVTDSIFAGHRDWRVPTIEELKTLIYCSSGQPQTWNNTGNGCEGDYDEPTIASEVFPNAPLERVLSSSLNGNGGNEWYVNFDQGYSSYSYSGKDNYGYIRMVRSVD